MQPVGGAPAPLSWLAETVLGALGALGVEATALQLCGRCFLSLRDVVAALDELERRGFVERVGRRWRATDAERADGRAARADPAASTAQLNRDGSR
jgi:hypothetical protein